MDIATRPDLLHLLSKPDLSTLETQARDIARGSGNKDDAKEAARNAAEKFEAFFLRTVLEDIIPTPKEDAFGGGGNAEKIWTSQLHEQYAEMLAKRGGIGIADLVYQQLLTLQEATQEVTQEVDEAVDETVGEAIGEAPPRRKNSTFEEQAR